MRSVQNYLDTIKAVDKPYGALMTQGGSGNSQIYEGSAGFGNQKYSSVVTFTNRQGDGVSKAIDGYDENILN